MPKNLELCLLLSLFAASMQGVAPAAASAGESKLDRPERRVLMNTILCARDLVQYSVDPVPGKFIALRLLSKAYLDLGSVEAQNGHARECLQSLSDLRSGELERRDPGFAKFREGYADWIRVSDSEEYPGVPKSVDYLVDDFVTGAGGRSYMECTLVGPEVAAGLGIVISADAEAGFCRGYDGRRWLAVGAGASVALGAGVAVSLQADPDFWTQAIETEVETVEAIYLGIGATVGENLGGHTDRVAIGAGLGAWVGKRAHAGVRLIPLGTNRRYLLKHFLE